MENKIDKTEKGLRSLVIGRIQSLNSQDLKLLTKELTKKNILPGEISALRIGLKDIKEVSRRELYWYMAALNEIDKSQSIDLRNYFSEKEINSFDIDEKIIDSAIHYPVVLEDVKQLSEDQWDAVINIEQWIYLYDKQIIAYNFDTQRNPLVKYTSSGEEYNSINVNTKSIKEIKEAILNGTFIPNQLTLNVNIDNSENDFIYDGKNFYLTAGHFDIIDGYHRYRAMISAKLEKPELDINFSCAIKAFDTKKARYYIGQEDKKTPLPKIYAKALDNRMENLVVNRLNEDSTSLLYKQINSVGKYVINAGQLATLIAAEFSLKTNADILKTKKILKDYFENIFNEVPELLEREIKYKELCILVRGYNYLENQSGRIEVIIEALQRTNLLESNYSFLRFLKKNRAEIDKLFKTVEKDMEVN